MPPWRLFPIYPLLFYYLPLQFCSLTIFAALQVLLTPSLPCFVPLHSGDAAPLLFVSHLVSFPRVVFTSWVSFRNFFSLFRVSLPPPPWDRFPPFSLFPPHTFFTVKSPPTPTCLSVEENWDICGRFCLASTPGHHSFRFQRMVLVDLPFGFFTLFFQCLRCLSFPFRGLCPTQL